MAVSLFVLIYCKSIQRAQPWQNMFQANYQVLTLWKLHQSVLAIKRSRVSFYAAPHDLKMEVILPVFNHTDLSCESCAILADNAKSN